MAEPQRLDDHCFVICPIGDDGSATRARSDKVLRHIVLPAARQCGYDDRAVIRADKMPRPGVISSQIIQHLVDAGLVVADLTDHNPNVFYELAIRHVLRKPVIQLIQAGQRIPFDIAQMRTITYDLSDPDTVVISRDQLVEQIRASQQEHLDADNPVSSAIQLKNLLQSENPIAKSHAEILASLQSLEATIARFFSGSANTGTRAKKDAVEAVEPKQFFR
jgi:hypothetical protein